MVCEKANELFTKFMDELLDDFDKMNLHKHLDVCEACREDFAIYSAMLKDFNDMEMEIIEAPEDFAPSVSEKIKGVNIYFPKKVRNRGKVIDSILFALWGLVVLTVGLGAALYFFADRFLPWLESVGLGGVAAFIAPFADVAANIGMAIGGYTEGLTGWIGGIGPFSLIFLFIFVALVALQIFMASKQMAKKNR